MPDIGAVYALRASIADGAGLASRARTRKEPSSSRRGERTFCLLASRSCAWSISHRNRSISEARSRSRSCDRPQ